MLVIIPFNIAIGTVAGDRLALIKERLITKKYEVTKEGDIILYEIWPNEFKEPLELDIEPPWWTKVCSTNCSSLFKTIIGLMKPTVAMGFKMFRIEHHS